MGFCKRGISVISDFMKKLEPVEKILTAIIAVTGEIKAILNSATVQQIEAVLAANPKLRKYFHDALVLILGIDIEVEALATTIHGWLKDKTEYEKNADLFKLASVATGVAHAAETGELHGESFYDTAIQVHVAGLK